VFFFPYEEEWNSFEGIDEREEKVVNKELVINGFKTVQRSHETNKDLAKFILALSCNTCALEESNK
jgi:hypothetical protein